MSDTADASAQGSAEPWKADELLADTSVRILLTCGSGGVGKTTTAAALALRAAEQHGRRAVVLTIDPARRLAQALGIGELDNDPAPVAVVDPDADGNHPEGVAGADSGGSLDAMMLDMKRTFDDVVLTHATPEKAEQIFANPFYQALSSSFAGTQEYMAMEKLGQLYAAAEADGRWDLIVVDTPPSRSALDFLDAPDRLASLLDGRFMRLLMAPTRGPLRVMTAGFGVATGLMSRILGAQVLKDVSTFAAAFETLFGGFRERADKTVALLRRSHTAFLVVATPQADALREATYFTRRLRDERMPLAGVLINRVTTSDLPGLSADRAAGAAEHLRVRATEDSDADRRTDDVRTADLLDLHAQRMRRIAAEQSQLARFVRGHRDVRLAGIPALEGDVHDLDGLREIAASIEALPD